MTDPVSPGGSRPAVSSDPARLKVLDVGNMVGGPFAATMMADLGAEVIKVERPVTGDFLRKYQDSDGLSLLWEVHGRNKRSITLDLSKPHGKKLLHRLAGWADILVENFRPGVMKRLGLDYDSLHEINPRLVYLSISGFGQTGPYAQRPAYEFVGAAFGGITFLTGFPDRPPVMPGLAITDHTSALFGAIGAIEAVRRRDAAGPAGKGTHVDSSLYEAAIRMSNAWLTAYSYTGQIQQREGSIPSGQSALHSRIGYVYPTNDGRFIANFAATLPQFERLCRAINRPELVNDSRFATEVDRSGPNYDILDAAVRAWVVEHSFDEAMEILIEADQPVAPVNGPAEILNDEHIATRGNLVDVTTSGGHMIKIPGVLPHLRDDPGSIRWPAEALGASNLDVYQGLLGLDQTEIEHLKKDGTI